MCRCASIAATNSLRGSDVQLACDAHWVCHAYVLSMQVSTPSAVYAVYQWGIMKEIGR